MTQSNISESKFVFTVFFCGTGSNSYDIHNPLYAMGELVSTLASHHTGHEFADWIIVDGPGSGNLQEDEKWVQPGNYNDLNGKLFGSGWKENVNYAVAVIKGNSTWKRVQLTKQEWEILKKAGILLDDPTRSWPMRLFDYPDRKITPQDIQVQKAKILRPKKPNSQETKLPDLVNIVGWSRGGVSCHMLANAMYDDQELKNIPVNILAFDPVPGLFKSKSGFVRTGKERVTLQENVKKYVGIYARDERSLGFAPIVPEFSKQTEVTIFPMPGRHATLVGNAANDGSKGRQEIFEPGIFVRDFAEKKLTDWGTKLQVANNNNTLTALEIINILERKEAEREKGVKSNSSISNNCLFNISGKLELSLEDQEWLYACMVAPNAEYKYNILQSKYYTVADGRGLERKVLVGHKSASTKFFRVKVNNSNVLAPVGEYLSWHHLKIYQELNDKTNNQQTAKPWPIELTTTPSDIITIVTQEELMKMPTPTTVMKSLDLQIKAGSPTASQKMWPSTVYAKIISKLEHYEEQLTQVKVDEVVIMTSLMGVNDEIMEWLAKNSTKINKQNRKIALEELQKQVTHELVKLAETSEEIAKKVHPKLIQLVLQGEFYTKSPTILLTYLMEKIIDIYEGDINKDNFIAEMYNFLIADNDLLGSTSLAIQNSGGSGGLKVGVDVGKFILPCFVLSVEVGADAKVTGNNMIVSECQAIPRNQNVEDMPINRYCIMNMNGRCLEGKLKGTVKIGVKASLNLTSSLVDDLETSSLKSFPKVEASTSAGASASGDITCAFMQLVTDSPHHYNLFETIEPKFFSIVTDKNQYQSASIKDQVKEVFFSFFSDAYGVGGEVGAEAGVGASAKGLSTGAKAEVKTGVNCLARFSQYTYQTKLSHGIFKTQATQMFFKQVNTAIEGSGSATIPGRDDLKITKKKVYGIVNSLQYQSGFIYWDKKTKQLSTEGESGIARGHSISADQLTNFFDNPTSEAQLEYVNSLAQMLGIEGKILKDFLIKELNQDLILDIFSVQKSGYFLEATFIPSEPISLELDEGTCPNKATFEQLSTQTNPILQSLRFRVALEDNKNADKTWFKLGLKLGVVKLGINLGSVENASSLKLTDYIVEWYDKAGQTIDNPLDQYKYVPSSFLFM